MQLNDLHPAVGSKRAKRRVGRGQSSGFGKTAGRGQKGKKPVPAAVFDPGSRVDSFLYRCGFQSLAFGLALVWQRRRSPSQRAGKSWTAIPSISKPQSSQRRAQRHEAGSNHAFR